MHERKKKALCQKDSYGCVNWGPAINSNEMAEQENFRKELEEMHKGDCQEIDWEKMASDEEVQISNLESWPRIAMLGSTSLAAREFALVVDCHVIGRYRSFSQVLCLLFCSYYIFNIQYPQKAAATLEFIQRSFVGINPGSGAKAS